MRVWRTGFMGRPSALLSIACDCLRQRPAKRGEPTGTMTTSSFSGTGDRDARVASSLVVVDRVLRSDLAEMTGQRFEDNPARTDELVRLHGAILDTSADIE